MDEFNGQKGSTREPVRSSMVVMTGKLLGVTESIAAMNLRIFAGVVFCIILLVATFVVNVIAFDYAKDSDSKNGALVSKSDGLTMTTRPFSAFEREPPLAPLTAESFFELKGISRPTLYQYTFASHEIFVCPEQGSEFCVNGKLFLATTTNGVKFYAHEVNGHVIPDLLPEDFAAKATERPSIKDTRHLLCHQTFGCGDHSQLSIVP